MSFQRRHGGSRAGSGRKPKNQTWGGINSRESIQNFFTTARPRQNESTNSPPPPAAAANTNTPLTNVNQEESNSESELQNVEINSLPTPNFDIDGADDIGDLHEKGKVIAKSENLRAQQDAIGKKTYYAKAYKNCKENGQCWDLPSTYVKKHSGDIHDCWKDFFKLRVFNWIPEALLGGTWRPKCPNCGTKMNRHKCDSPPRLVFDTHENYWLNSPDRYICKACERYNKSIEGTDEAPKQISHCCTNDAIIEQLCASHAELMDIFPCHLTRKNAIDKKLLDTVIHSAVKGIGPQAFSENIVSWHQQEWQKRELQWARYNINLLNQPSLTPINRSEIKKCPHYFSDKLGGCTPSGKWLIEMLCEYVDLRRPYYDSECVKRAILSKILAIDASYKVPKWMMKWGGQRLYDALHSGTNEYNEIILQRFSTSDNHQELGAILETLSSLGLNPYLPFSDDPTHDESLLHKFFSNLRNGSEEQEEENPTTFDEIKTEKSILYLYKYQDALDSLSRFRSDVEDALANPDNGKVKLALDVGTS